MTVADEVLAKRVDKLVEKIDKLVEDILRAKEITDEDMTESLRHYIRHYILGMTIELNGVFEVLKIMDAYFKGHKDRGGVKGVGKRNV